ncbi:hypothetical protein HAX54_012660, partial [Datura stramonium]|nr:hypothetical protein [Datura stramonium]
LVEVVQHIIVRRTDCGTAWGISVSPQNGLTMEEYFRDVNEKDVLLFINNIFRFVQASLPIPAGESRPFNREILKLKRLDIEELSIHKIRIIDTGLFHRKGEFCVPIEAE